MSRQSHSSHLPLSSLSSHSSHSPQQIRSFRNPVIPGFFPDPSIVRVGRDFYLVNSSFEYYPGIPVFHSTDLVNWTLIGHVLTRTSQLDLSDRGSSRGIFAPTIRYHKGKFYVITTDVDGIGNFYVTAEHPAGPWSDPIRIPYGGIDPSLFFEDDGKVYVTVQQGADADSHIIQYEIDPETGRALTEPVVVFRGDGGPWVEGPHLYRIRGMYYLMTASGGTSRDHREIIGRSNRPYGPFELLTHPILTHRGLPDHPIQYTGHADLVDDPDGNWWAVFLGVRLAQGRYSVLGRETFLAPVRWTADGWPMIDNNEGVVSLRMESDKLWAPQRLRLSFTDEFAEKRLHLRWHFLRRVPEGRFRCGEGRGLELLGLAAALQDRKPSVFVSVRQTSHRVRVRTILHFAPVVEGEEAGVAARLSDEAFVRFGVRKADDGPALIVVSCDQGRLSEQLHPYPHPYPSGGNSPVHLELTSDETWYTMRYSLDGELWHELARHPVARLSPETNWCFTGVCLGMYATGNGRDSVTPARFERFEYLDLDSDDPDDLPA